jgi:NADH:ubiquinone oxidoreductase subunit H
VVVASVVVAVLVATAAVALSTAVQQQISVGRSSALACPVCFLACWLALVALAKKCGSDLNDNPVEHDKQKRT